MGPEVGGQGTSEDRLSRLEAALATQQRQIDQLRSENATLRREGQPPDLAPPSASPAALGRRSLLTKGLAAAGAATAGAVLLGTEPAAAANGQGLVIGGNNFATAATRLNVTAPGTDGGLQIIDSGGPASLLGAKPALVVSATGAPLSEGIRVLGSARGITVSAGGTGLLCSGGDVGVYAGTDGVIAVEAVHRGPAGVAVRAASDVGTGVLATGATSGVHGRASVGTGTGVVAENSLGTALRATGRGGAEIVASAFHLRLGNAATRNAPTGDTFAHVAGDIVETTAGELWVCTTAGTPGTWRKLAGPNTAGAFHVLPAPARVYDSRPGSAPTAVGPKTPFASGATRTFDLKVNGSLVPAGATAAMVTLLLVNAANASGNLTIWAGGAAKPVANTLVWGGSAGRFTATAVTALDAQARVQVNASARTDLVIDVVGFYR